MKSIKILAIIIMILAIALGIKISGINILPEKMGETEIRELIKKGISYENLHIIIEDSTGKTENFIKDNIMVVKKDEMYVWQDFDTNEIITLKGNSALRQKEANELSLISKYPIASYLDSTKYKIEYDKKEVINEKECVLINIIYLDSSVDIVLNYALDEETGLVMKNEVVADYTYSIGTVTDKDVEKPDLSKYNVVDLDKVNK